MIRFTLPALSLLALAACAPAAETPPQTPGETPAAAYIALGTEPGWTLEITPSRLNYDGDYGETSQGGAAGWGQNGAQGGQQGGGQAGGWGGSGGGQNGAQQREEPPFDGGQQASEAPKPSRSRKKAETAAPAAAPSEPGNMDLIAIGVREKVLLAVLAASPDESMEDIIDIADDMAGYILTGEKPTN